MKPTARKRVRWSTSAFGGTPHPSSEEMSELTTHLEECRRARGRMFSLRSKIEAMHGIFSNRLVTIAVVVALLLLVAALIYAA